MNRDPEPTFTRLAETSKAIPKVPPIPSRIRLRLQWMVRWARGPNASILDWLRKSGWAGTANPLEEIVQEFEAMLEEDERRRR